jgi:aryl-alcohol dehydrogenase-like predicted oxidoreductase
MSLRPLGKSDLMVSSWCLGGNVFGWTADERDSFDVLDAYVAEGGNFIDTAEVYSRWAPGHQGGESEAVIGRWLASRGRPEGLVIATKVGFPMGDAPEAQGLGRRRIEEAVEGSLRRLGVEAIDLYLAHRDDPNTPLEETLDAFDALVKAGKVRHVGGSNYSAARIAEVMSVASEHGFRPFEAYQPEYNLLDRSDFEGPVEEVCASHGIGVFTYFSLASGFLTGKYRPGRPLPASGRAAKVQATYMNPRGYRVLEALDAVAEAHGATVAQVALAWVMARPGVTAAIASATDRQQVLDLAPAMRLRLSDAEMAMLTAAGAVEA